jgi:HK97 gp10 family phage protein
MADQNIIGGRALDAALQTLSAKVEKNILRSALRQGANQFRDEVRANIPVESGDLRRSVRVSTRSKGGTVYASLKIGSKKAFYARFLEFGTQPHGVKKGASVKRGKYQDGTLNPGLVPRAYARPAFDAKAGQALAAIMAQIRKRLTAEGINSPAPEVL